MPLTNAPPRPSMVKAPATCSGSPRRRRRPPSRRRTRRRSARPCRRTAPAGARSQVDQAVPGVQHPAAAAHRAPPRPGVVGVVGLAEDAAVELEHRVAAEHQQVGAGRRQVALAGQPLDDGLGLELGKARRERRRVGLVTCDSSTPETSTRGSTPALRNVASRAGDADASTRRGRVMTAGRARPAAGRVRSSRGQGRSGGTPSGRSGRRAGLGVVAGLQPDAFADLVRRWPGRASRGSGRPRTR